MSVSYARSVWNEMKRWKPGNAQGDGYVLQDLDGCFDRVWEALVQRVENGSFCPGAVRWFVREKSDGCQRILAYLPALDRVLHRVLAEGLKPATEKLFSDRSFAFRSKRSTKSAIHLLCQEMRGRRYLLRVDIKDCFGSIRHEVLYQSLTDLGVDEDFMALVKVLVSRAERISGDGSELGVGIQQGSPLSPLLSNLVLDFLDKKLEEKQVRFVRFADDLAISLKSSREGKSVLHFIQAILKTMGMQLNLKKCVIAPAEEVEFLGFAFRRSHEDALVWRPGVSVVNRERLIEKVESWCQETLSHHWKTEVRGTFSSGYQMFSDVAKMAGQIFAEWFAYYRHTGDREGLEITGKRVREVLRQEVWRYLETLERRDAFFQKRGVCVEKKEMCLPVGRVAALRKVMPRENFAKFGLDGRVFIPQGKKKWLGYDGNVSK